MAALNMTTRMTPYQDSSRENGAKALTVLVCRVGTTPSCCKTEGDYISPITTLRVSGYSLCRGTVPSFVQ